jgi:hypothetical protein
MSRLDLLDLWSGWWEPHFENHWIGLRENLNRKPWFLPSNFVGFPVIFPIIQFYVKKMDGNTYESWETYDG